MKKYFTNNTDSKEKDEVEFLNENTVSVNKKEYDYDYKFLNPNVVMLRMNDKNFMVTVSDNDEEEYYDVNLGSQMYKIVAKSELDLLVDKMSSGKNEGKEKKEIYSPMPGIITKMNVTEGQKVVKGEVLLVLEAMKMENEIKAKKDCVIKKVNVAELKSVEKNELLLLLE